MMAALNRTCDDLIDEAILGLCFEIHRSLKMGTFFLDEMDETSEKEYKIVDEIGLDVFGQVPMKKQLECVCPNCQRNLAASRFAPHLEKCMGMGRSSSRIANRRIANSGKDAGSEDDENDDDWTCNSDRKNSKKKRERGSGHNHSPRRSKLAKFKNGDLPSISEVTGSLSNFEGMSSEEKKTVLVQMCGVISEHTKKMCTRSHRCPQHTDEQRKLIRIGLLGQHGANLDLSDDIQVDIDTLDDLDGQMLRDSLGNMWDGVSSANLSPTDSTSTNNSTASSKKKEKRSKNGSSFRSKKSSSSQNSKSKNSSNSSSSSVALDVNNLS